MERSASRTFVRENTSPVLNLIWRRTSVSGTSVTPMMSSFPTLYCRPSMTWIVMVTAARARSAPTFADREYDLHVTVGKRLGLGRDLDLEVAFLLVVILELFSRALDVDGVVDTAKLEVDLVTERVVADPAVPGELDVPHERPLHD